MSMFLPESTGQQPVQGVASITPANPETTQEDIALMQRVLAAASRNPNLIPTDFMAYVMDFIQTQRLSIPIGEVFGFKQFVSTQVSIFHDQGQSLSGTGNTTTPGPSVALPAGKYVFIAGADMTTQFGNGFASLSVSSGGPTVSGNTASISSVAKATAVTLSVDTTITSTLAINGGGSVTCSISGAWLVAIRYDNA
jgi:hypothetical protein